MKIMLMIINDPTQKKFLLKKVSPTVLNKELVLDKLGPTVDKSMRKSQ